MSDTAYWVDVESVCKECYGVSYATAKNKIQQGTFPVPTYKVGRKHVIDKTVHEAFFAKHRNNGLAVLKVTTKN